VTELSAFKRHLTKRRLKNATASVTLLAPLADILSRRKRKERIRARFNARLARIQIRRETGNAEAFASDIAHAQRRAAGLRCEANYINLNKRQFVY